MMSGFECEPITIKRLDDFREVVREYDRLLEKKEQIIEKISLISAVDYSKSKVMTGSTKKSSEEERYTIALEEVNRQIKEYEAWILPEREVIRKQFGRIKRWEYRKVLVYRYLKKWKWSEIIKDFFEFEDDYEAEKQEKYKDKVMYWHRQAIKELEEVSKLPTVQQQRQLTIGE